MVESVRLFRYGPVNKRSEVKREHGVDLEGKKLCDGGKWPSNYDRPPSRTTKKAAGKNLHEREIYIDPDFQVLVRHKLRNAERNKLRTNEAEKENAHGKNLERGILETNHDDVLPLVPENYEINDRSKRQREDVVNIDVDGYGSDADPELLNVFDCLKEYGNAYAFEDENYGLIIYEGECSSDDVSECNSPRETRTNRGQQTNVNSIDENPRVDLVVESVHRGTKGILRKRKNDGPDGRGTVDWVPVNSREVLNQKRVEFSSKKLYFEKNSRKLLKEKNVVQIEVEEEDDDDDDDYDYDEQEEEDDDVDVTDEEDDVTDEDDDVTDEDDDVTDEEDDDDDYDDAYDYDDDCDGDYNYREDVDEEYSVERNLRKFLKGKNIVRKDYDVKKKDVIQQNKEYLNRRCSPGFNLVMEDEKPNLGKSNKMDKLKNVVYEVNESIAKPNKWFKQDNGRSIGPSRPYKQKMVHSGENLKEKVKREKVLTIAVEERDSDSDSDEIEILDISDVFKEGNCFAPSKNTDQNGAGGPNGCADYRQRVLRVLNEPYDANEYRRLFEEVNVYLKRFPDLKRKLAKNRYWVGKRLPILRGFFYWLQKTPHNGAFKPWTDAECLSVNLKVSNA